LDIGGQGGGKRGVRQPSPVILVESGDRELREKKDARSRGEREKKGTTWGKKTPKDSWERVWGGE